MSQINKVTAWEALREMESEGIIENLNVRMNTGQLLENFAISEFEKIIRNKKGTGKLLLTGPS
jgi:hypothetical protein